MKKYDSLFTESEADLFLELASPIRLEILKSLLKKERRMRMIASSTGCTPQEVNRNLHRLHNAGLVTKTVNNTYSITNNGRILSTMFSLVDFVVRNTNYLESKDLQQMDTKFIKRLGVLTGCKKVTGVCRVLDTWSSIYRNADQFICDMVSESPSNLVEPLMNRLNNGVRYKHVFTENKTEPDEYSYTLSELGYYALVEKGLVERKVTKRIWAIVVLNEKEGGIIFNSQDGYPDMRTMFYGDSPEFHDFCLDIFEYWWSKKSQPYTKIPNVMP